MKTVYNAEPYGYSEVAKEKWTEKGYVYREGSWKEIENTTTLEKVHVLIVRLKKKVTQEVLSKFPNLRFLITATTGLDHIDEVALDQHKVKLVSLRPYKEFLQTIPSTAEHTWGLLLSLLRNIPQAHADTVQGNWRRDTFRGYELSGKTIGLIGLGRTGAKVAQYAKAFDMNVCFYDPFVATDESYQRMESLEQLMVQSNIISIHVHLTKDTECLVNHEVLSHLNPGSYLINTSRGNIWDENAVVQCLENKVLRGVATDVLANELDEINSSPLWKYAQLNKNVILSPHLGGATWDAMWACEEFICENFNEDSN